MKKTLLITGLLTLSLALFVGCSSEESSSSNKVMVADTNLITTDTNVESSEISTENLALSETQTALDAFTSIDIDALSPDIEIVTGEEYSVEYKLHDREHVDVLEVKDETLIFDTGYNFEFDVDYGNFFIKITVPEDVAFENVDVKTVAGNIYTDIAEIEDTTLVTTSGEITIDNAIIPDLYAKSTSENIEITGEFENIDISTVSGRVDVTSDSLDGDIQTVSGNITVNTSDTEVSANSFGEVRLNGDNKGYRYESSNATLDIVSVSGGITVE